MQTYHSIKKYSDNSENTHYVKTIVFFIEFKKKTAH